MANEIWASDANYPAGGDPWSGTPTKVAPDAAEIAAGHVPSIIDPAEKENWWKNRIDSAVLPEIAERRPLSLDYQGGAGWTGAIVVNGGTIVVGIDIVSGAGLAQLVVPLWLPKIRKLRRVTLEVFGNGVDNILGQVTTPADAATAASADPPSLGTTNLVAPAAAWQRLTIDCADTLIDDTHEPVLFFQAGGAGIRARHLRVVHIPA